MKLVKGCIPLIVVTLVLQTPFSYGQAVFGPVEQSPQFVVGPTSPTTNTGGAVFGPGPSTEGTSSSGPLYVGPIRISETEYVEKLFHLVSIPFAGAEIIMNQCKPAGGGLPDSLSSFASASKGFITAELERDALIKQRTGLLEKVATDLAAKKDAELHVEAIRLQLDTMNINLDAVTGSSLFQRDKSQKLATETAGIPQLEKLAVKILAAIAMNQKDHKDMVDNYIKLTEGITESGKIAAEACKRKKKVEECTVCEGGGCAENTDVQTCTTVEKDDPVPGSCEMSALLPPYANGPVKEYADLYLKPKMASTELNNGMKKLEEAMKTMVTSFPKSNDPQYDWTSPLLQHEKMADTRKKYGVLCPSYDSKGESKEKSDMDNTAANFLLPLGVGGELGKKAGQIMNANWNVADQVIGQPGNRAEAFTLALKFINEMIKIENSRVQMKLAEYDALKAALAKLVPSMSGGKSVTPCGGPVVGPTPPNPACQTSGSAGGASGGGGSAGGSTAGASGGATSGSTSGGGSGAVASSGTSTGNGKLNSNVGATSANGGALADLPDNEIIRRNADKTRYTTSGDSAPPEITFAAASGDFAVGPLSAANSAIAKSLTGQIKDTTASLNRTIKDSAQSKSGTLASTSNSNFGNVAKFGEEYVASGKEIASVDDYKAFARAISGASVSSNGNVSAAEKIMRTTSRDLGYSFGGKGAQTNGGHTYSSTTSSGSSNNVVAAKGPSPAEATDDESSPQKWQKRAQPIELFDNISNAYKKHGRSKLGLDEIRGENE